jgi:hypothetical protein
MQPQFLAKMLSVLGFIIGEAVHAHWELVPYEQRNGVLLFVANLFCPPALLPMLFFGVNAHSIESFWVGWSLRY